MSLRHVLLLKQYKQDREKRMSGQYGIEQIKKVALAGCELLNVISKVVHKQGIFTVFQLSDELMALSSIDGEALKKEISELDQADRDGIKSLVKEKLVLQNPVVESKIEGGVDILDEAVSIVLDAVKVVSKAKSLLS